MRFVKNFVLVVLWTVIVFVAGAVSTKECGWIKNKLNQHLGQAQPACCQPKSEIHTRDPKHGGLLAKPCNCQPCENDALAVCNFDCKCPK